MTAIDTFARRDQTISVCLPAKNEEPTIGAALEPLMAMKRAGYVNQVVVIDDSEDYTAVIAESLGAEVHGAHELVPELHMVQGKGDSLWRALTVLTGDIVLFLDADSRSIQRHYVFAMCAPILRGEAELVKGHYRRAFAGDDDGGARVNHLLARPLLRAHFPALGWVKQPLAGETAMTRELALSLPFVYGYGVEIGLLLDAHLAGRRIAQVDLHEHDHRHRPLHQLGPMCDAIVEVVLDRGDVPCVSRPQERPPMQEYAPVMLR